MYEHFMDMKLLVTIYRKPLPYITTYINIFGYV